MKKPAGFVSWFWGFMMKIEWCLDSVGLFVE